MHTLTNRAKTFRAELTDENWEKYVETEGLRAREIVLTLAGQTIEHRRRLSDPYPMPSDDELRADYTKSCVVSALAESAYSHQIGRWLQGGAISQSMQAIISGAVATALAALSTNGLPDDFRSRAVAHCEEMRAFETRCANRSDMIVTQLEVR
jgi:hypothetical protein